MTRPPGLPGQVADDAISMLVDSPPGLENGSTETTTVPVTRDRPGQCGVWTSTQFPAITIGGDLTLVSGDLGPGPAAWSALVLDVTGFAALALRASGALRALRGGGAR